MTAIIVALRSSAGSAWASLMGCSGASARTPATETTMLMTAASLMSGVQGRGDDVRNGGHSPRRANAARCSEQHAKKFRVRVDPHDRSGHALMTEHVIA